MKASVLLKPCSAKLRMRHCGKRVQETCNSWHACKLVEKNASQSMINNVFPQMQRSKWLFFFDCGGEITSLSFRRYAQEVDPRWLVRIAGSKVWSEDPLWLGSHVAESPTRHLVWLQEVQRSERPTFARGHLKDWSMKRLVHTKSSLETRVRSAG